MDPKKAYYEKRGRKLTEVLKRRHFDAVYCESREEALKEALHQISKEDVVAWGGALTCHQIGLMDALEDQGYRTINREKAATPEERTQCLRDGLLSDVFLTGANAISMTGEMVNIDGTGNRVAAIVYGPRKVLVVAGMNKVVDSLPDAMNRARTIAAPMNQQRFEDCSTACHTSGKCGDCLGEGCICNQILITRNCRPAGRISFILIGDDLGF